MTIKRKQVWVSQDYHKMLKLQSAMRGMNITDYTKKEANQFWNNVNKNDNVQKSQLKEWKKLFRI